MPFPEKKYAEELSKLLGIPEKEAKKVADLIARRWRKKIVEAFKVPEEIEIPKVEKEVRPKVIRFAIPLSEIAKTIPLEDLVELISPRLEKLLTSKEFIDTIVDELSERLDYEIRRI
ncbi:MAG TPA: hypothetical protein ENG34_00610, partial [Candidatus Aenigmarchaeota archaeon]|nr:hypothetical protein [Candidatus Aenigmarchaeota archaeon]